MSTGTVEEGRPGAEKNAKRRYRRRLATARNVKAALRDLYGKLEANEIDVKRARAMAHVLHVLVGVIIGSEFEERIATLERADRGRDGGQRLAS